MRKIPLDDDVIVAQYRAGSTMAALANTRGVTEWSIKNRLLSAGEPLRRTGPARRHELNEQFFADINTEAKAYWLGFVLADGRVAPTTRGNYITRVNLAICDTGHIEKFKAAVESGAPIKLANKGASAFIDLCSRPLCHDLMNLGVTADKTGNHGTPPVPEDLQHHFYRGYHDGDGAMYPFPQNHSWMYDCIGAPKFIEEYQQWLMARAGVNQTRLVHRPPVCSVRYQGGAQVERICRVLYQDATVYLDRKFATFQQLLARKKRQVA